MLSLLVYILCVALVLGLVLWIIRLLPLPPPFDLVAQVVVALIFLLILIDLLTGSRFFGGLPALR